MHHTAVNYLENSTYRKNVHEIEENAPQQHNNECINPLCVSLKKCQTITVIISHSNKLQYIQTSWVPRKVAAEEPSPLSRTRLSCIFGNMSSMCEELAWSCLERGLEHGVRWKIQSLQRRGKCHHGSNHLENPCTYTSVQNDLQPYNLESCYYNSVSSPSPTQGTGMRWSNDPTYKREYHSASKNRMRGM
jgi:hypothetical protein